MTASTPTVSENVIVAPPVYKTWTVVELAELSKSGFLPPEKRYELIFGQLLEQLPINSPHASTVRRLKRFFAKRFPNDEYEISQEAPVVLSDVSQPRPDCFVALFREDLYENQHPQAPEVLVVIEVADASLQYDRVTKLRMYASASIQEYWIVNLVNKQIELYLKPDPDSGQYANYQHYVRDEVFSSPVVGQVAVNEIISASV